MSAGSYRGVPGSRIELARIYSDQKKIEDAQNLLNQVIKDRNDELAAEAQKVLGDVYFNAGNYNEALTSYLRVKYVYQAYPGWVARALYAAGNTYEKLGQPAEAKKVYQEIVDKFPTEKISDKAKERLAAL
ncbi:MAG: tetratricopeptide repeat protein [Calditrichia bacterium]